MRQSLDPRFLDPTLPEPAPRSPGYSALARRPEIHRIIFLVTGRAFPAEILDDSLLDLCAGYHALYGPTEGAARIKAQLSRRQRAVIRAVSRNAKRMGLI